MKHLSTLFATGALALLGLGAQAQAPITVNGQLTASEVATSGYQLVGRFTGTRGFGDAGLLALYAAADANNLYFFLAGTLENNSGGVSNSLQLFIDRPGVAGVPVGTTLPLATGAGSTSFANTAIKLDLAPDLAIGIKGTGAANQVQVDGVAYTSATAGTAATLTGTTPLATNGTAGTIPAANASGALGGFAGAQVAYTSSSLLSTNPGFASNGNAPSNGLEIMVSRSAMGLPAAGGTVQIFALMNNGGGGYLSSDFIPQATAPIPTNLGYPLPNLGGPQSGTPNAVDFANIPGTQAASLNVTASGLTVLSSRSRNAVAVGLSVYPNPSRGEATVSYRVPAGSPAVRVELTDLLGRRVSTVFEGAQSAGQQTQKVSSSGVTAGTYLLKVQVGEQVATQKVTVL
jgi:hypothetical protein